MKNISLNSIKIDKDFPGKKDTIADTGKNVRKNDVAIIGMSIRAGSAENLDEYWDMIASKRVDLRIPDEQRREDFFNFLDSEGGINYRKKIKFKKFSCMNDIDKFDNDFFGINPSEAETMDPNQRLFLQTSYNALENAGYAAKNIEGRKIGFYVGFAGRGSEYEKLLFPEEGADHGKVFTGNLTPVVASRLSYYMNLTGPAFLISSSCSSSLMAVHTAIKSLQNGDCDMAVAGSVDFRIFLPIVMDGQLDIYSADGFTRTFDDFSDGTNDGEACAAIVLKPLSRAIEDRDNIMAVIKGTAVNHDGRSASISAPNGKAQENLLIKAWADAEVDPSTISFMECHGTATALGDPIEVTAISNAMKRYTSRKQFCAVGSVKTNISHCDAVAGVNSIIKMVLAMQHKQLPPDAMFDVPSQKLDFIDSPLYVSDELRDWNEDVLRCGIGGFGINGTNVHIVMEEYKNPRTTSDIETVNILTLSAKTSTALKNYAKEYIDFLNADSGMSLSDLAYTVNTSRKECEYRFVSVFRSAEELKKDILELIESIDKGAAVVVQCKKDCSDSEKLIKAFADSGRTDASKLSELAELFMSGKSINWNLFYHGRNLNRISAPVYPFDKKRFWFDYNGKRVFYNKFRKLCDSLIGDNDMTEELRIKLDDFMQDYIPFVDDVNNKTQQVEVTITGRANGEYSDTEKFIAQKCYETFGYSTIGIDQSFDSFNGDSLQMMAFFTRLKKEYDISLTDIYSNNTIESLAVVCSGMNTSLRERYMQFMEEAEKAKAQQAERVSLSEVFADELRDYKLKSAFAETIDLSDDCEYRNVLLTGATGFLGVFILREFLENSNSRVTAVIRAVSDQAAMERLSDNCDHYLGDGFFERYRDRIDVFAGDLSAINFGLDEECYIRLADSVDCIMHSAANSSHFGDYSAFYTANVVATDNIIAFAETGIRKSIHHISTASVNRFKEHDSNTFCSEFTAVDTSFIDTIDNYYVKTKVIAENLIENARKRGLEANIYRLDNISFVYDSGIMQKNIENNAVALIIQSFCNIGAVITDQPAYNDFSFVDYAARAISLIMHKKSLLNHNYVVTNPNRGDYMQLMRNSNLLEGIKAYDLTGFVHMGLDACENNDENAEAIFNLMVHVLDDGKIDSDEVSYPRLTANGYTVAILKRLGFTWPEPDQSAFNRFISYCRKIGFIK